MHVCVCVCVWPIINYTHNQGMPYKLFTCPQRQSLLIRPERQERTQRNISKYSKKRQKNKVRAERERERGRM